MRDLLSRQAVNLKPSGIRKFFDIVSEMEDALSLGVGEPDLIRPGISGTRVSIRWKKGVPSIHPTAD